MALITVLIRTKGRESLKKCIESVESQSFKQWDIILHSDVGQLDYPYKQIHSERGTGFDFNLYCNKLKSEVDSGLFFFLDDDDYLIDGSLQKVWDNRSECMIVQFSRAGWPKPSDDDIKNRMLINGKCGMPCLILDAKHKHMADIAAVEDGDFLWICDVIGKINPTWHNFAVVYSEKRSFGA